MTQVQQSSIKDINVFTTASGEIAFHNNKYMTPKTIDIMTTFLDKQILGESGLDAVIFRTDGFPREENRLISWKFFPDSRTAVCNIINCIDIALAEATDEKIEDSECLSVWAATWLNIIMNFFHEVHHAQAYDVNREDLENDKDEREHEEELAREYANDMIELMAKQYEQGIEPEFTTDINGMIGVRVTIKAEEIMENKNATEKELRWVECMKYMDDHSIVYYAPAELTADNVPITINTLKEYLYSTSGDAENDISWDIPTKNEVHIGIEATPDTSVAAPEIVETIPTNTTIIPPTIQLEVPEDDGLDDEPLPFEPDEPAVIQQPAQPVMPQATTPVATPTTPVIGEKLYEDLGWDIPKVQAIIKSVYGKIAHHIFSTCGFNPSMNPFFAQHEKIVEFIPLTSDELCIVKHMDCYNESGQFRQNVEVTHGISGIYIDKAKTLVGYTLSMNTGNGNQMRRKFVPQNPWKKKGDGNYSATALEAQQGNQILWILDPDAVDKSLCARIRNGVLESNISGTWCAA